MMIKLSERLFIKAEDVSVIELDNGAIDCCSKVLVRGQWVRLNQDQTAILKKSFGIRHPSEEEKQKNELE